MGTFFELGEIIFPYFLSLCDILNANVLRQSRRCLACADRYISVALRHKTSGRKVFMEETKTMEPVTEEAVAEVQAEATANEQTEAAAQEQTQPAAAMEDAPAQETAESPAAQPQESMDDYAKELEASFKKINEGDILTGTVIGVTETEITLDFGYYTDGLIKLEDASDDPSFSIKDRIEVGQTLSATVIRRDDGAGHILLSMKEAAAEMAWDRLKALLNSQENLTVKITGVTKGGAIAYVEGIRGFIPASKLSLGYVEEDDLPNWLNKSIDVRVITADEAENRLVMSARDILREAADAERAKKISNVEVGLVTEGTVETIKPYGAFIDLGNGLSGLVHISQISQQRIKHPSVVLKEGQKVKVKVIAVKDGKLSLSMKALEDVAAQEIVEETFEMPETEAATTSLGSLFAKLKL